jgi:hypothetical protein
MATTYYPIYKQAYDVYASTSGGTTPNQKPTATLSGATTGTVGSSQPFQSTATDTDGQVTMVELCLMANATTLTDFTVQKLDVFAPYEFAWTPTSAGNFILRARATDDQGATGFSAPLTIVVSNPAGPPPAGQTIRLSERGIVSDSDVTSMHSTLFGINQRAAIQAIVDSLDTTLSNTIINDCKASIDDSIKLVSNTTWIDEGDNGLLLLPSEKDDNGVLVPNAAGVVFENKNKRGGRGELNTTGFDKNITIRGGYTNGAGYDANGNELQPAATDKRAWPGFYSFAGVDGLLIEDKTFLNARSIMGRTMNCKNVLVQRCKLANSPTLPAQSLRHDGPKFIGPADNCMLLDCEIDQVGDDLFSFCGCDIWFPTNGKYEPDGSGILDFDLLGASYGTMTNCVARNIKAIEGKPGYHGARLMNAGQKQDVLLDNIYGRVGEYLFTADPYTPSELFKAPSGTVDALFGTIRVQNCTYTLVPNFDRPYYKGQNPNDMTYDGASMIVRARVDSLQLENVNEVSGYSTRKPTMILDYQGSIADMYGNDVTVGGVPSPPLSSFIFRGAVGGTRGNLFAQSAGPVGVQRLTPSNAPFIVGLFDERIFFSFKNPNQVLFLTDASGITTHLITLVEARTGDAGQLHVVNNDSVPHFIQIPDNQAPFNTNERYILLDPGERVDFLICNYTDIVGWWVDRNPTAPLGIAAPVPAGYKYGVSPMTVYDETKNGYYQQLSGTYRRDPATQASPYDSGSAIVIEPLQDGQITIPGGFARAIGLRAPTENTQYKGVFHLYVSIDGGPEFEVIPRPSQKLPSVVGNASYQYYTYRYDTSYHHYQVRIKNDEVDPSLYLTYDGYYLLD